VAPNTYSNDIRNTGAAPPPNYGYDAIGNTIKDLVSGQDTIRWNLYNKVKETHNNSAHNGMLFDYDAGGNRVAKYFTQINDTGNTERNEYYVRDAQGNILAIYRENLQYKVQVINWIHEAHASAVTFGMMPHDFTDLWVAPQFATSGEFSLALHNYAMANNDFVTMQMDRPVSYFMRNADMYENMVDASTNYILPLIAYEQRGSDSILVPAMQAAAYSADKNLRDLLGQLFTDSAIAGHAYGLLCTARADSLFNQAMGYNTHDTLVSCDSLMVYLRGKLGIYASQTQAAAMMADNFATAGSAFPAQYAAFAGLLSTDSVITANKKFLTGTKGKYLSYLQSFLVNYGSKSHILDFFDQYDAAEDMLDNVASTDDLMNICYNTNPASFIFAVDSMLGRDYIDSSIAAVPELMARSYVERLAGRLTRVIDRGRYLENWYTTQTVIARHTFELAEHDIYGSSRLGVKNYWPGQVGLKWDFTGSSYDTLSYRQRQPWYSAMYQDVIKDTARNLYGNRHVAKFVTKHITGQKQYELTDHLGDVLATVSDAREPADTVTGHTIAWYKPVVKSAYDYYPFGMLMPGRYTNDSSTHCTNTSQIIMVPVTTSVFHPFILHEDPVVIWHGGSVIDIGPLGPGIRFQTDGSAQGGHTDAISWDVRELAEDSRVTQAMDIAFAGRSGNYMLMVVDTADGDSTLLTTMQLSDNVNSDTITVQFKTAARRVLAYVTPGTMGGTGIGLAGYYTYTVTMVPHTVVTTVCSEDQYRYGYNEQMKVNEWAGVGNHTTALFWEYDTRTGRRYNLEPEIKKTPNLSPYVTNQNSPVQYNDPNGDFPAWALGKPIFWIISRVNIILDLFDAAISNTPLGLSEATFIENQKLHIRAMSHTQKSQSTGKAGVGKHQNQQAYKKAPKGQKHENKSPKHGAKERRLKGKENP